jgi:UDP-N-acetyl-D-glucosamine dehydrogenase
MAILEIISMKEARIGVIGLGYVGLPLVIAFCRAGFPVMGFDIDESKVELLNQGKSYIKHIDSSSLEKALEDGFTATTDFDVLREMDCILICVPKELNKNRKPNITCVFKAGSYVAETLHRGQLVVLESTIYPRTMSEDLLAILEKDGLRVGEDFYLAFSREREDPDSGHVNVRNVSKVIAGCTPKCQEAATALYKCIVERTVHVSSPD